MSVARLGDIIDDHCTRCHMLTDHSVVAMVGEDVKKVRCRICSNEHDFRHGQGGKPKKAKKLSAYEEVLASITAGMPVHAAQPEAPKSPRSAPPRRRFSLKGRVLPKR
jgi:hypothetical protein